MTRPNKAPSDMMTMADARHKLGIHKRNGRFRQLVREKGNGRKLPRDAVEALWKTKQLEDTCRSVGSVVGQLREEFPDSVLSVNHEWLKEFAKRELRITPKKAEFHMNARLFNASETDRLLKLARETLRRPRIYKSELAAKWRLPVALIDCAAHACAIDCETKRAILSEDVSTIKLWIQSQEGLGFIETEAREKLIEQDIYRRRLARLAKKNWAIVRDWLHEEKMMFRHGYTFYFNEDVADEQVALLMSKLASSRLIGAKKPRRRAPRKVRGLAENLQMRQSFVPSPWREQGGASSFVSVTVAYQHLKASGLTCSKQWLFKRLRALWAAGVIDLEQQTTGLHVRGSDLSSWLEAGDVPSLPKG